MTAMKEWSGFGGLSHLLALLEQLPPDWQDEVIDIAVELARLRIKWEQQRRAKEAA